MSQIAFFVLNCRVVFICINISHFFVSLIVAAVEGLLDCFHFLILQTMLPWLSPVMLCVFAWEVMWGGTWRRGRWLAALPDVARLPPREVLPFIFLPRVCENSIRVRVPMSSLIFSFYMDLTDHSTCCFLLYCTNINVTLNKRMKALIASWSLSPRPGRCASVLFSALYHEHFAILAQSFVPF